MTLYHQEPHLHGGEVSYAVKLKHDFNISTGEALISPTHVVVPGPHIVDVTVCKIIQATHSIRQLAQALCHTETQRQKSVKRGSNVKPYTINLGILIDPDLKFQDQQINAVV